MSEDVLSTALYRSFGGRDRRFELRLGEIRELERLCKAGTGEIYQRVVTLRYYIDDLRETIRLGLIGGGGCSHPEAEAIVRFSVDGRPISEYFEVAVGVLASLQVGVKPGKINGAESSGAPETSAPITGLAAPQDSAPETSTQ